MCYLYVGCMHKRITLQGCIDHSKLHRPGCNSQFSIDRDSSGRERLVYKEDPL